MKEQFVTYEVALKLKELGFNEPCLGYYYTLNGKTWMFALKDEYNRIDDELNIGGNFSILAPLWQQAIDWLREKYHLDIIVSSNLLGYGFIIYQRYPPKNVTDSRVFQFYPESREQAILKALELIKK